MKAGDLVKHMDGRVGIIEWFNDDTLYPIFVSVIIPTTGENPWWEIDKVQVISESRR